MLKLRQTWGRLNTACVTVVTPGAEPDFLVHLVEGQCGVEELRTAIKKHTGKCELSQQLFLIGGNSTTDGGNVQKPLKDTDMINGVCFVLLIVQRVRWCTPSTIIHVSSMNSYWFAHPVLPRLSADGSLLMTVATIRNQCDPFHYTSAVIVRNVETGAELRRFECVLHVATNMTTAVLSADGKRLSTVHTKFNEQGHKTSSTVVVCSVETGNELQKFKHHNPVTDVALSADGRLILIVESKMDQDGCILNPVQLSSTVVVCSVETGNELQKFAYDKPVTDVALSADGTLMLMVKTKMDEDGFAESSTVVVHSVETGAEQQKFEYAKPVTTVAISADGNSFLAVVTKMDEDGFAESSTVVVYSVETGKTLHTFQSERAVTVTASTISEDGDLLMIATHTREPMKDSGTCTIIDIGTGRHLYNLKDGDPASSHLSYLCANGRSLLTAKDDVLTIRCEY